MSEEIKEGKTTSEYKLALVGYGVGIGMAVMGILIVVGAIPADVGEKLKPLVGALITAIGGLILGLDGLGYSISRGLAKKG